MSGKNEDKKYNFLMRINSQRKRINWKKLFIVGTILKILITSVILIIMYFYHQYYHENNFPTPIEDLNNTLNDNFTTIDENSINKNKIAITEEDQKYFTQNELNQILQTVSPKKHLILLNNFYKLKFNIINQCSNNQEIKNFHDDFIKEFSDSQIINNIKFLNENINKYYSKETIINKINECFYNNNAKNFINIENITQKESENAKIISIIEKIQQEEWKKALDMIQSENINKHFLEIRLEIIKDIQATLTIKNCLKSIENFLQITLNLS